MHISKIHRDSDRFFNAAFAQHTHHPTLLRWKYWRDRCRGSSRHFSHHTGTTDQHIPGGIIQHMTHVENAGDIRRRNNNGVGFALVGCRMKIPLLHPAGIPFILNFGRIICFQKSPCRNPNKSENPLISRFEGKISDKKGSGKYFRWGNYPRKYIQLSTRNSRRISGFYTWRYLGHADRSFYFAAYAS